MKLPILLSVFGALALTVTSASSVQISVNLGINPCGYPVIYQTCPVVAPPAAIYLGGGFWGGDRGWRGDGRDGRGRGPVGRGGRR